MSNENLRKNNAKVLLIIISIIVVVFALAVYFGLMQHQVKATAQNIKIDGVYLTTPIEIADFSLKATDGRDFSKASLHGKWTMLFFGFTNCGMVCPTTMAALNSMYLTLQKQIPENNLPQIVMVSVDPERDTIVRMKEYVTAFNSHFIGARTNVNDTLALEKQLHIVSAKMQVDGGTKNQYTMNHSAEIMLFNPEGKLQAFMSYPHLPAQMIKDYQAIISTSVS